MADFRHAQDVEAWVLDHQREHGGDGADALQRAVSIGVISGRNAEQARAWLDERQNGERRRAEADDRELQRRATVAAETSAKAAVDAATHAADSAKWARWAAIVAAAALIVSAWPFIKDLGRAVAKVGG